jgi:NAD(P)-dependent dehydrogenase (short-subunit alcohol dehydrogenase family)
LRILVLVNNAGIALRHKDDDLNELRESYNKIFNTNITSIATLTSSFLPLLRPGGKVINISSGRASISRSVNGNLPPTAVVAYSVSKVALNALTIEFQKSENARENQGGKDEEGGGETGKKKGVEFFVVNPGHCKTEFNGYRGTKDPVDGAEVVVRLVGAENGDFKKGGFWEFEEGGMREVPW